MKLKVIFLSVVILLGVSGCDVAKQVSGAYNMVNCKYDYNSISNMDLAGINFNQGLSLTNVAKVTSILSGTATSIPLNFTLNLDVTNPNQTSAFLNGLDYILNIDGLTFTTGSLSQTLDIPAGGENILPLSIGLDLASLLKGESADAVGNVVKNFIGIGSEKSNVTLQIRPSFTVSGYSIPAPAYIPVSFTFGGK